MKNWISLWLLFLLLGCQSAKKMPVAIGLERMQVLYEGLANPITYVYTGVSCKDLELDCDRKRALIEKQDDCSFLITPLGGWKDGLELNCYKERIDKEHFLEQRVLRVLPIPQPVASLNGNTGGSISRGALLAVKQVSTVLEGFAFEGVSYRPTSFEYVVVQAKTKRVLLRGQQKGHAIPPDLRDEFSELEQGDLIHIFNIMARPNVEGLAEILVQNNLSMVLR